jgi:hypothetical protein
MFSNVVFFPFFDALLGIRLMGLFQSWLFIFLLVIYLQSATTSDRHAQAVPPSILK